MTVIINNFISYNVAIKAREEIDNSKFSSDSNYLEFIASTRKTLNGLQKSESVESLETVLKGLR